MTTSDRPKRSREVVLLKAYVEIEWTTGCRTNRRGTIRDLIQALSGRWGFGCIKTSDGQLGWWRIISPTIEQHVSPRRIERGIGKFDLGPVCNPEGCEKA